MSFMISQDKSTSPTINGALQIYVIYMYIVRKTKKKPNTENSLINLFLKS